MTEQQHNQMKRFLESELKKLTCVGRKTIFLLVSGKYTDAEINKKLKTSHNHVHAFKRTHENLIQLIKKLSTNIEE